jgi:hypothetical protein
MTAFKASPSQAGRAKSGMPPFHPEWLFAVNRPSWSRQRLPGSNVQGGSGVSLTQHSAVKGVREGRRLASAVECQAQNGAIELKQPRHDPASV